MRDDTRKRILQRRAAFLAAAVSSAAGCGPCNPFVCLEPAIDPRRDVGAADTGLSGATDAADVATDAHEDTSDAGDAALETSKPTLKPHLRPCLSAPVQKDPLP